MQAEIKRSESWTTVPQTRHEIEARRFTDKAAASRAFKRLLLENNQSSKLSHDDEPLHHLLTEWATAIREQASQENAARLPVCLIIHIDEFQAEPWASACLTRAIRNAHMRLETEHNVSAVSLLNRESESHPMSMAELRPDTVLLEPHGTSLLMEELEVEREEGTKAPKPESMMRVISRLEKDEDKGTIEITNRVALHDVVNQDLFTAGLTTAGSEGIDAWARVGEDKVVLFQTKGQQKGSAVGQPGNNAMLARKDLHDYIKSLMLSAYASADNLVKRKFRTFCTAESEETRADCQTQLVCSCMLCARVCLYA